MKAICPVCGKEFTPPAKHHGGRPATYCSLRCRDAKNRRAYRERLRAAGKKRPSRAKVREPRACAFCGKVFTPKQYSTKYCSKKCGNAEYFRRNREKLRAKERAYLKLPARARWANRGMLTDTELRMAEQMWKNHHDGWEVRFNTSMH